MTAADTFRAIVARRDDATGSTSLKLETVGEDLLPDADVTVDVDYSSLNYKDGLALLGKSRILKTFPMAPGIDFSGAVRQSNSANFAPGDSVVCTGWGIGESWSGGFSERARVKGEWLVKLPDGLSPRGAMIIGTAGFTAMLCVIALEKAGVSPGETVLVTGAGGGVGSMAVALLAKHGFKVVALTGRPEHHDFLRSLGAGSFVSRADFENPGKPLQPERWKGAVDTAGGHILANVLASTQYGGAVAACGLASSMDLPATVAPFILRGVSLLGIDSVYCPRDRRQEAWDRLARDLSADELQAIAQEVSLQDVLGMGEAIIQGRVRGRTVVNVRQI